MYIIAIVGRPNVGKSTLFNRLTRNYNSRAIVDDSPGVTRDRREGAGHLAGLDFGLVDTAGLETAKAGSLADRMRAQTEKATSEADLIIMLFDARAGITEDDRFFANAMRRGGGRVLLVGNKCEGGAGADGLAEAYGLGLGDPVGVSAAHGEGLGDLHDAIVEIAGEQGRLDALTGGSDDESFDEDEGEDVNRPMRIAFIGRPNMGKSTLVNRLVGEERLLTGAEPGITRDAIEIPFESDGRELILIDTAGMRRRARIHDGLEKQMVEDATRAIRFAHVCVLLIDGREELGKQDLAIARHVAEEGRALIIGVNMWDEVRAREAALKELNHRLEQSLGQLRGIPVQPISGLKGSGVDKLMDKAFEIYGLWNTRIPTSALNRWLENMLEAHPPPLVDGRRLRIRYATQIKTRPPTFALFASRPKDLPDHYLRYLSHGMREAFGLDGVPLRLVLRKGDNPYA